VSSDRRPLSFGDRLLVWTAGALGPIALRALGGTWRVTTLGARRVTAARAAAGPVVFAFWHGTLLPLEHLNRGRGICVLSSWHRDGEMSARVMTRLGYRVVRGSSSRGGARGLQALVQAARAGSDVAVTPDGPRGPAGRAQAGALLIASRTGAAVVPVGVAAAGAARLSSWDRFMVPLPFARVAVAYGEPFVVGAGGPRGEDVALLEARLGEATGEAAAVCRGGPREARRGVSAGYGAYRAASRLLGAVAAPVLSILAAGLAEWRERLGRFPAVRPGCVWVHAASVGEVAAAAPVVAALRGRGLGVLLTAVTRAGREAAGRLADGDGLVASHAPLDLVPAVRRALDGARPRALLLVETELWPNLVSEAFARGVPVAVVNGRLSAGSAGWYASPWSPVRGIASGLDVVACQTERDAASFRAVGVPAERVLVAGNTKFETAAAEAPDAAAVRSSLGLAGADAVVVFGSVRPREERAVALAAAALAREHPGTRFLVAPRHLARVRHVAAALERAGLAVGLRSEATGPEAAPQAVVLDTTGELRRAYGAATAAFVGGTLAPYGGHNPLEPAALGVPVVIGPHVDSCRDSAAALVEAGAAVSVDGAAGLAGALGRFLSDPRLRATASVAALRVVSSGRGAVARTLAGLDEARVLGGPHGRARDGGGAT
jgi:3-deoxy-D-manno-octulosonic-acid transferase